MITKFSMDVERNSHVFVLPRESGVVRLWSQERETLQDALDALELAGWAESAPEPVSGLELLSGVAETLPRSNGVRHEPITRAELRGWQVDVTRSDLALLLTWEALNG